MKIELTDEECFDLKEELEFIFTNFGDFSKDSIISKLYNLVKEDD